MIIRALVDHIIKRLQEEGYSVRSEPARESISKLVRREGYSVFSCCVNFQSMIFWKSSRVNARRYLLDLKDPRITEKLVQIIKNYR